jgi:peptidoglycan/LPS O-acetylase OafA/YrhL
MNTANSYGGFHQYLLSAAFCIFYVGNLFGFAHLGFNDLSVALGHFWTLAVEEQFYFVWPLVLWALLRKWNRILSAFCIAGVLITPLIHYFFSLSHKSTWTLPTSYLDLFFFGALFTIHRDRVRNIGRPLILMLLGTAALTMILVFGIQQEDFHSQGYFIFSITEVILFLGLLNWKAFGQIKVLRQLGDLSYSLYCIHWPIICLFHDVRMNPIPKFLITVTITFVLAALSTKYYETIFWKPRYLDSKLNSK